MNTKKIKKEEICIRCGHSKKCHFDIDMDLSGCSARGNPMYSLWDCDCGKFVKEVLK